MILINHLKQSLRTSHVILYKILSLYVALKSNRHDSNYTLLHDFRVVSSYVTRCIEMNVFDSDYTRILVRNVPYTRVVYSYVIGPQYFH